MDLVTHAIMGALAGCAVVLSKSGNPSDQTTISGRLRKRRSAAIAGTLAGLLPDADALIQSGSDALLVLDYHRHFTHALAFTPIGALLASLLVWPWLRKYLRFFETFAACFLAYLLHPLLDACTSYGTHLWLPVSDTKVAWNLIAVADPLFTLLLAVPLGYLLRRDTRWPLTVALALGASYLMLCSWQQSRVDRAATEIALSRGHTPGKLTVKPSMANIVLWRTVYVHEGRVYADAYHAGSAIHHYPGESAPLLDRTEAAKQFADTPYRLADVERFRSFSDELIIADQTHPGLIGDARYAMLPSAVSPIWGIRWSGPGAATEFVSHHDFSPAMRATFMRMLLGRPLPEQHGTQ